MRIYFISALLLSMMLFAACKLVLNNQNVPENPFSVIESEYYEWHAGVRNGGSGINYQIQLLVNVNKPIFFDSIFVNKSAGKLSVIKQNNLLSDQSKIHKGDTLLLMATILKNQESKIMSAINHEQVEGHIVYYINSQKTHFAITSFDKMDAPLRP